MTIRGGNPASFRLAIASRSSMRGTAPPPSVAVLRTMLAAALTENPPQKVVILASDHGAPRRAFADATLRGGAVITRSVDPWEAIARAERLYAAGGRNKRR